MLFLVNNRDRLIDVFSEIDQESIVDTEEAAVITENWSIPREQYYKQHKKLNQLLIKIKMSLPITAIAF